MCCEVHSLLSSHNNLCLAEGRSIVLLMTRTSFLVVRTLFVLVSEAWQSKSVQECPCVSTVSRDIDIVFSQVYPPFWRWQSVRIENMPGTSRVPLPWHFCRKIQRIINRIGMKDYAYQTDQTEVPTDSFCFQFLFLLFVWRALELARRRGEILDDNKDEERLEWWEAKMKKWNLQDETGKVWED